MERKVKHNDEIFKLTGQGLAYYGGALVKGNYLRVLTDEAKEFLSDLGDYQFDDTYIYFAEEESAMMFKMKYGKGG